MIVNSPVPWRRILTGVYDLMSFVLSWTLPSRLSNYILPRIDHFAYHLSGHTRFEGYYTRIQTEDGSTIVVIISSVHGAQAWGAKSHFVHFSLTPSTRSRLRPLRVDRYPDEITYTALGGALADGRQAFRLRADRFAVFSVDSDTQFYWLSLPDPDHEGQTLTVSVRMTERTPLHPSDPLYTPHNSVVRLGSLIPVHWHIFSTLSIAEYSITRRSYFRDLDGSTRRDEELIAQGKGLAHMEKNWGKGFPDSWTWMQGFSSVSLTHQSSLEPTTTLAIAGGTTGIPGIKSYLVVYRSPSAGIHWDFAVPWGSLFSFTAGGSSWGLFCRESISKLRPEVIIDVSAFTRRLVIRARGDTDIKKWLPLDCPLLTGHGNITACETFSAEIEVKAYVRSPWQIFNPFAWKLVERRVFEDAAFELGGDYRDAAMREIDFTSENDRKTR